MAATDTPAGRDVLLDVRDLAVNFHTPAGTVSAVRGVSFSIAAGEIWGIVGESGSGKTVTSRAILGLVKPPGVVAAGEVSWKGRPFVGPGVRTDDTGVLGRHISLIPQDPMSSLNPLMTIGAQITEVLRRHRGMSRDDARNRAAELLDMVGITKARERLGQRPHELSGGMRQRVMIAAAIAAEPELIVADEPTTALDVTVQAQILELLMDLQKAMRLAIVLITHDLGVVSTVCDSIMVMYGGKILERGSTAELLGAPRHPYLSALVASAPRLESAKSRLPTIPGSPPDLLNPPPGCPFQPRCTRSTDACAVMPAATRDSTAADHLYSCYHPVGTELGSHV